MARVVQHVLHAEGEQLQPRRHKVLGCAVCDYERALGNEFHPSHDASERCQSGKRNHCSCDVCF